MGDIVDQVTGKSTKQQLRLSREAQRRQEQVIAAQERATAAVAEGQKRASKRGGGLLAYVDDELRKRLGG